MSTNTSMHISIIYYISNNVGKKKLFRKLFRFKNTISNSLFFTSEIQLHAGEKMF